MCIYLQGYNSVVQITQLKNTTETYSLTCDLYKTP